MTVNCVSFPGITFHPCVPCPICVVPCNDNSLADLYRVRPLKQSQLLIQSLFSALGRAVRSSHRPRASRFGSAVAACALLGWLTACDVSHFRLDTEHGAPPFFSPSPLTNPVLTHALAVATAMQPFATHAVNPLSDLRAQIELGSKWNDTVGTLSLRLSH